MSVMLAVVLMCVVAGVSGGAGVDIGVAVVIIWYFELRSLWLVSMMLLNGGGSLVLDARVVVVLVVVLVCLSVVSCGGVCWLNVCAC